MRHKIIGPVLLAAALLASCTSGDDDDDAADTESTPTAADVETTTPAADGGDTDGTVDGAEGDGAETTTTLEALEGPAPGVTDDTITIGITYVDLQSLPGLNIDHGDYEAAFTAVVDDINARGGIHGRLLEASIYPISLSDAAQPESVCVQMTEDDDAFAVIGFFLFDNVLCPIEVHETMVIGGEMNAERLERARAPWFTVEAGSDRISDLVRAWAEGGELDGTVGVVAGVDDQGLVDDIAQPILDEAGIAVADVGVIDVVDTSDRAAINAAVQVIIERFRSAGVDQVLLVGQGASNAWPNGAEATDYRPKLLVTNVDPALAYVNDAAGRDLSVFDGALSGGFYGPRDDIFALANMGPCLEIMAAAGLEIPETEPPIGDPDQLVSSQNACLTMALFVALAEAAGPNLNYATIERAAENGVEVVLPTQPDPAVYGPPPSADGDRQVYIFRFDPEAKTFSDRRS